MDSATNSTTRSTMLLGQVVPVAFDAQARFKRSAFARNDALLLLEHAPFGVEFFCSSTHLSGLKPTHTRGPNSYRASLLTRLLHEFHNNAEGTAHLSVSMSMT